MFLTDLEWEWDFYQVILATMETERIPNHRLSLRRNKKTGRYEVYRHFHARRIIELKEAIIETSEDLQAEEIAFQGSFEDAVRFANSEMAKYGMVKFHICQHKPPNISPTCPNAKRTFSHQLQGVVWRLKKPRRCT
jgi:hypothetical protein